MRAITRKKVNIKAWLLGILNIEHGCHTYTAATGTGG